MDEYCTENGCVNRVHSDPLADRVCEIHGVMCSSTKCKGIIRKTVVSGRCKRLVKSTKKFCRKHKCIVPGCEEHRYEHTNTILSIPFLLRLITGRSSPYCIYHAYDKEFGSHNLDRCFLCFRRTFTPSDDDHVHCISEKCAHNGCNKLKIGTYDYCPDHKCHKERCNRSIHDEKAESCMMHKCRIHKNKLAITDNICRECILDKKDELYEKNRRNSFRDCTSLHY